VWPSYRPTSYSSLHDRPLDAITVERLAIIHDFLSEAAEATAATLSAGAPRCSDCPVDPTSLSYLHTFLQTTKYEKIQARFKKLGNKHSDPENFIPNPTYTCHTGSGQYTSDLHIDKGKKKVK